MLLLNILGLILLIIIILLAVLIIIPYSYVVKGDNIENRIAFSVLWLFGILRITYSKNFNQNDELTIELFNFSKKVLIKHNKVKMQEKSKEDKATKKKTLKWKNHINKAVVEKVMILLSKVWRGCKPNNVLIDAKIGFRDPMYTGFLYALYSYFSFLPIRQNIQLQPIFHEETLKGRFLISGRIWIAYLLAAIIEFLLSTPIRHEIKLIRKERRCLK